MPTADGKPIAEDVVALLQQKPSPIVLSQNLDLITGGLTDLVERVRNLEYALLAANEGSRIATAKVDDHEKRVAALEGDRRHDRTRLDKVEAAPHADSKRLEDLEKRVRTVEGAVGSTAYKAAKEAPAKTEPFKGPDAIAPVAAKPTT